MLLNIYQNIQWKKTAIGTPIPLYASHKNLEFKSAPILLIGGVHGDEPEGVNLANNLLNYLTELSQKKHTYKSEWLLIPCLNPDGYNSAERVNSNGVDLNRNFPSTDWSPAYTKDRYYPGKKPASEIETQSVIDLIQKYLPKLIIHFHSWKPLIVYTGKSAEPLAQRISSISGYDLQEDIGYPTPGSLGQYGAYNCKIGVICIEEEERVDPKESWQRFKKIFEEIF